MAVAVERHAATVPFSHFRQGSIRNFGSRAEPEVPVEPFGNRHGRDDGRGFHAVDAAGDSFDLADATILTIATACRNRWSHSVRCIVPT